MNKYKVAVIVPIYNVEKYLKRCIDSIVNQTMKEIEIVLVDDGSPDKSGEICDEYAQKDSRIKVIHQENAGLSAARNAGIKVATAEYVCFIDSDDYIAEDMVEYLYRGTQKYNSEIACCGLTNIYENGKIERVTKQNEEEVFDKEKALDIHLLTGYIEVIACNKMYKKELFNDILYPEGYLYEDMLTTYKLIDRSKNISFHPESKYFYCKRSTSIGGANFSCKTLKLLDACDQAVDYILDKYSHLENIRISRIQWYIVVLNKMILANKTDYTLVKRIKTMIKKEIKILLNNKYLNLTRKCQILLLLVNYKIYAILYKKFILKNR